MKKNLYKAEQGKKISGVCMGFADYFDVDVTIIRLCVVVGTVVTGFWLGIIIYIACVFVMPDENDTSDVFKGGSSDSDVFGNENKKDVFDGDFKEKQ